MNQQKANNNNQNNNEDVTVASIRIQPRDFEMTHAVALINTKQLSDMIDDVFGSTFEDYYGSKISVNNNGIIIAEISFTPLVDGYRTSGERLVALENTIAPNKKGTSSMMNTIQRWNGVKASSTRYRLSQEGKEALAPFVGRNFRTGFDQERKIPKINWGAATQEICLGSVYQNPNAQIAFKVTIDINEFIGKYYGSKTEDGTKVSYIITVQRALGLVPELQMQQGGFQTTYANNYAFEVIQINEESAIKANATIIGVPATNLMGFSNAQRR